MSRQPSDSRRSNSGDTTQADQSGPQDGGRLRARSGLVARRMGLRANLEVTTDPRRRVLGLLPSLFTLLNMMSGFLAILMAITGRPEFAAVLIAISVVLDITDGAVARLVRSVTPFGLQFDSLADLVSFGVAPAILAFTVLSGMPLTVSPVGLLASFLWLACAAIRLARFNVTIDPTADKRFFNGLPSPGAAGVLIASVFAFPAPVTDPQRFLAVVIVAIPALLMISSIRYRSFRSLISPKSRRPYGLIGFTAVLAVGFVLDPAITGCVIAYSYLAIPILLPARSTAPSA